MSNFHNNKEELVSGGVSPQPARPHFGIPNDGGKKGNTPQPAREPFGNYPQPARQPAQQPAPSENPKK